MKALGMEECMGSGSSAEAGIERPQQRRTQDRRRARWRLITERIQSTVEGHPRQRIGSGSMAWQRSRDGSLSRQDREEANEVIGGDQLEVPVTALVT